MTDLGLRLTDSMLFMFFSGAFRCLSPLQPGKLLFENKERRRREVPPF